MLKISYASCLGLSPVILAQFTIEIRVTAWNREKFTKNPLCSDFEVIQGHRCWYPWKARQQCFAYLQPHTRPVNSSKI